MRIEPQFNRDPLRRERHRVLASDGKPNASGKCGYFIVGTGEEPIELMKLHVGMLHALNHKDFGGVENAAVKIVNEEGREVASFDTYAVPDESGPPSEHRIAVRDRWLENVMRWLLPERLYAARNLPEKQPILRRWFKRKRIAIEMRPDGGAVRIWRDGKVLCEWGC